MLKIEIIRFEAQDVITTSIAVNPGNAGCKGCYEKIEMRKARAAAFTYIHNDTICTCDDDGSPCGCPVPEN